jgi:lipoprotein-anchoring transpeptidase ErfK/SrfK
MRSRTILWMIAGVLIAGAIGTVTYRSIRVHAARTPAPAQPAVRDSRIVISLSERKLTVFEQGNRVGEYEIAIGKPETPTPTGVFHITDKQTHPGPPTGVFGVRWMEFYRTTDRSGTLLMYGIHGTNAPEKIGGAVSHGCIRLSNTDVEEVFRHAYVGEPVEIVDAPAAQSPTPGQS